MVMQNVAPYIDAEPVGEEVNPSEAVQPSLACKPHVPWIISVLLAAAVFLAPYVAFKMSIVFITPSDILLCLTAIAIGVHGKIILRNVGGVAPVWLTTFLIMIGGLLIGSVINGDTLEWVQIALQYFFAYIFVPFLLIMIANDASIYLVAKSAIAGVFTMEAVGGLLYYLIPSAHTKLNFICFNFISGAGRLGSFTDNANWNGAMIAMALPLVYYLRSTNRLGIVPTVIAIATLLMGLMLTASNTGIISTLAGALIFCLVARVGPRPSILILVAAITVGVMTSDGFTLPQAFNKRVAGAMESGDIDEAGTFVGRMKLIEEAWNVVERTPVIGLGANQYRVKSIYGAPVHNTYLLLWAEGGLASLLGWVGMLLVLAAASLNALLRDRFRGALGLSVLSVFLVNTNCTPHMYARIWCVPLAAAMAIVLIEPKRQARRRQEDQPPTELLGDLGQQPAG